MQQQSGPSLAQLSHLGGTVQQTEHLCFSASQTK